MPKEATYQAPLSGPLEVFLNGGEEPLNVGHYVAAALTGGHSYKPDEPYYWRGWEPVQPGNKPLLNPNLVENETDLPLAKLMGAIQALNDRTSWKELFDTNPGSNLNEVTQALPAGTTNQLADALERGNKNLFNVWLGALGASSLLGANTLNQIDAAYHTHPATSVVMKHAEELQQAGSSEQVRENLLTLFAPHGGLTIDTMKIQKGVCPAHNFTEVLGAAVTRFLSDDENWRLFQEALTK